MRRLSGIEEEPNGPQRWQASADDAQGELDVGPKEDGSSVIDDVVGMLEVLAGDGVGCYNARDTDSTYPVLSISLMLCGT